jgi:hypothetical protein
MRFARQNHRKRNGGLTLIDILAIVAVMALLAALLIPKLIRAKRMASRIMCVNNLAHTGLAFRTWSADHTNNFPMSVPQTNGGTMEFITGPNAFRHFQIMSNDLVTPKVLFCPAECDRARELASAWDTNWPYPPVISGNSNISYFVGIDANETNPWMILAGDHNITNGTPLKNSILEATTNFAAGWTADMHIKIGNILLADGSVQQVDTSGLRKLVADASLATNRLQMP